MRRENLGETERSSSRSVFPLGIVVYVLTFSSPQKEDWGRTKIYQFFTTVKKEVL